MSSEVEKRLYGAMRSVCPKCGTGVAYRNGDFLPDIVEFQSAMLDNPDALPAGAHIKTAERIGWIGNAHSLPEFGRYPG